MKKNRKPYLIIGNSAAAMAAVAGIRNIEKKNPITIVSDEPHFTYSRPLISYFLAGKVDSDRMFYREKDYYEKNQVDAILGKHVTGLNLKNKEAVLAGKSTIPFKKLLIATGGTPFVPEVKGAKASGVFTFTTWEDAKKIKSFIQKKKVKKALVIGGGLIGLKAIEALTTLGVKCTLVELADRILSITFDDTASELAQDSLKNAGVNVVCGTTVSKITSKKGKLHHAVLENGDEVPCQMVIFAIGVTPNTDIVKKTSIKIGRGILVDDHMQTSVKDVYAAGDVAEVKDNILGITRPIPILPTAYRQGKVAGRNMAGDHEDYGGGIAMNSIEICGLPTVSVGLTAPDEDGYEILERIDREGSVYKKIVLKNDRIVGAIFVGNIDRAGIITGLIKEETSIANFKEHLLNEDFGLISLPKDYRKHMVTGTSIEI